MTETPTTGIPADVWKSFQAFTSDPRPGNRPACMWFLLCDRPADGLGDAGPSGWVPVCRRCARVVGLDRKPDRVRWLDA